MEGSLLRANALASPDHSAGENGGNDNQAQCRAVAPTVCSSPETIYLSFSEIEKSSGDEHNRQYSCFLTRDSPRRKVLEWIFAVSNFVIELSSIVFDQVSSQHNSLFLPICMGMSFLAFIISILELVYKARKERVVWRWKGMLPWFYYTSPTLSRFGSFLDIAGPFCASGQCILATISYFLFLKTGKNQIKVSVWPGIFAFCQLCSKFLGRTKHDVPGQDTLLYT